MVTPRCYACKTEADLTIGVKYSLQRTLLVQWPDCFQQFHFTGVNHILYT